METKRENIVSAILGRLLFIGFSAQIVFGILWVIRNINYLPLFGDTAYYVSLSGMFVGDGDTGIIYSAILLLTRAIGSVIYVPWYSIMYILQLVLAAVAGYFLIKEATSLKAKPLRCVWGSLAIITFYPVMQLHMAVLPNSIILSLLMLEAAMTIRAFRKLEGNELRTGDYVYSISAVALFWLLLSLTKWIYVFIGILPVIAALIRCVVTVKAIDKRIRKLADKNMLAEIRKAWVLPIMTVLIFGALILGIDRLTLEDGSSVRQQFSVDKLLFERMAWKSRFSRESTWLLEITAVVDREVMTKTAQHQENVKLLFEPALEKAVGEEEAIELMRFTNAVVWNYDRREFLHDVLIDAAGYMVPQVMIGQFMKKTSFDTYTPRNYDVFKRNTPVLAKYYVDYSLAWGIAALGICVAILILRLTTKTIRIRKHEAIAFAVIGIICVVIAVRNVMLGSGVYDYKEAGSAMVAWLMVIFAISGSSIFDEDVR